MAAPRKRHMPISIGKSASWINSTIRNARRSGWRLFRALSPQDRHRLLVGGYREHFDLRERSAADWVLDHHEGVVGQAHHAGDVPRRDLEGFGAKDDGAFAELLEADAVMQTAR